MIQILNAEPENYCDEARQILYLIGGLHEKALTRKDLLACLPNYDVLIVRLGHQVDREMLDRGSRLRFVVTATTGLNHIDIDYADAKGITILSLRGQTEFLKTVRATAELTIGLALALIRHIPAAAASVYKGAWNRDLFRGTELYGKTAGIVGMGRLGTIVANMLQAFGMRVVGYDPRPDFPTDIAIQANSLYNLLAQSDLISLHVLYDKLTHHLIGLPEFAAMKFGSILINTSRGEIIDETALLAALCNGHLAGAALDVLQGEPDITGDHPVVAHARNHSNLLIVPHIGGNTRESFIKTEIFMAQQLRKAIRAISIC